MKNRFVLLLFLAIVSVPLSAQYAPSLAINPLATPAPEPTPLPPIKMTRLLSDYLTTATPLPGPQLPGFYAEIPKNLEQGVRHAAADNYTSAAVEFLEQLENTTDPRDKARVHTWLSITYGQQAIDYPGEGQNLATSSTHHLQEALKLDPEAFDGPDVARIAAEMIGHGWAESDPQLTLNKLETKANQTKLGVDYYHAGVVSRRLGQRAWAYGDTTEQDKRTLSLFARAVARDPLKYEYWTGYLRSLMPVGLHDVATTEATRMYPYFENLRVPLMGGDQGPAVLQINVSSYRTIQQDEDQLNSITERWPDAPTGRFEMAMRAIETTVPLAMEWFPEIISDIESGKIKLMPKEAGYYPSALYKYAFLLQQENQLTSSVETYKKIKTISPNYAEVDSNIAVVLAQMSDGETTGPKKLALLEEAKQYAEKQKENDFRNKSADRTAQLIERLDTLIAAVKTEMGTPAADRRTTPTAAN